MKPSHWVSPIPRNPAEQKPNHYLEMARVAWENRDQLPFAWRTAHVAAQDWETLEAESGTTRATMRRFAEMLRDARNGIFVWSMREGRYDADPRALRRADEIGRAAPLYAGIERLKAKGDQFQWGGPRLFADGVFNTPDGMFHVSTRRGKQFNAIVSMEKA